jgi:pimeloyl-ACP methyl ester carboxylesterase
MWTAVALALLHGAILGLCAVWAVGRIAVGAAVWPFAAALPLVVLALPLLFTAVSFTLSHAWGVERPPWTRLGPRARVRLFVDEFLTIAGNAVRMIGYRWLMRDPPARRAQLPILLVHGVLCNAGVWHPFARRLRERDAGPVYAISYGPPLASIDLFAQQLSRRIDAILAATQAPRVMIVAQSMGGLVVRACLRDGSGAKIARVVTIGSPHRLARAGRVHGADAPGQRVAGRARRPAGRCAADRVPVVVARLDGRAADLVARRVRRERRDLRRGAQRAAARPRGVRAGACGDCHRARRELMSVI